MASYKRLFIAEKPSLAEHIAHSLAEVMNVKATKADGCWTVGEDRVGWLFGHMYELAEPKLYGEKWARWSIDSLPMIVEDDKWKLVISDDKKPHMKKVSDLIRNATTIVNAGDPAREGQLLVDEVLLENGVDPFTNKVSRLWVQSMARKDMIAAIGAISPNSARRALYDSAVCRQRADWQHGMNFSRLFTLLARNSGSEAKISVGRVQTPTLRLVVDRDRERMAFKPVDHFIPRIVFMHENGTFNASWVTPADYDGLDSEGRLVDKKVAEGIVSRISGKQGKIVSYKADLKYTPAPLPYSLSALQAECGSKLSLTAKETLDIAQSLYEKHRATTYPRSDSRHLPTTIFKDEAPGILAVLSRTPGFEDAGRHADSSIKSAAWDDAKVSDHHGIIPTTEFSPGKLAQMTDTEKKVFTLIARSFLVQFYPPFKYRALSAEVSCEKERFKANGRQILDQGWKTVYGAEDVEEDANADEEQSIPVMAQNDPVTAKSGDISSRRTSAPPAFRDGTLITAMANVHRFVTNEEIKKRLKETDGIGTEATRADTIETLLRRQFFKRKGKDGLESTELGRSVIDIVPEDLKDPGLTALWEGRLQLVEKGELTPTVFMTQQSQYITKKIDSLRGHTVTVKGAKSIRQEEGSGESCPKCGETHKGVMVTREIPKGEHKGKRYLSCSRYPDCDYKRWPQPPVEPMPGHGKACVLCKTGKMLTRAGVSKEGKPYKCLACSNYPTCKGVEWEARAEVAPIEGSGALCQVCKKGHMKTLEVKKEGPNKGKKFLACDSQDCKNMVWPEESVEPLPEHGKPCPECKIGKMFTKGINAKDGRKLRLLVCSNKENCKHEEWPPREETATKTASGKFNSKK